MPNVRFLHDIPSLKEHRSVAFVAELGHSCLAPPDKPHLLFQWNNNCIIDLIRFTGHLHNAHLDLVESKDGKLLELAYAEEYALLQRSY